MSEELKPCPFCGGEGNYHSEEEGFTAYLTVICKKCGSESAAVRYRSYDNGIDDDTRAYVPPKERKEEAADLWNRRAPVAARELDVEAECPGSHHLTMENVAAVIKDLREIADGTTERSIYSRDWVVYSGVLALIIEWLAARRASPAPVSTEQAGDAWISVEDRLPEDCTFVAIFDPENDGMPVRTAHWLAGSRTFESEYGWLAWDEVSHWMPLPAAPSPNNSPVGADSGKDQ